MTQNKKIALQTLIILFIILFTFSPVITAWDNCPFGFIDDPYPGACGRYIDTNNDGICDLSQPNPATSQSQETEDEESTVVETPGQNTQNSSHQEIYVNKNLLILIASFVLSTIAILISKTLTKKKILSKTKEKILWNIILLILFLPSAITGVILILMVDLPFLREISINFIELHSYTSFFFMWISGYHILWHTTYYINGMKKLAKK